ncbi:putative F420-0 ABC transporter substrate-binding protein [Homoserinibacter sp. YIM 151385]|nr:putative F420-0 ABC transporter substrate-binding protein [Homoserinibacter sp. YIM 151385]WBU39366.1 putative F420-0 ABC transporter substrate-binding protein [Homoserinibacter sp. YIM 151385]
MRSRAIPALALVSLAAAALAGCAAVTAPGSPASPAAGGAGADTIRNCGVEVPIGRAPERVVTIKSTSTEMLLALGLGDRIVGSAFADGPVPERWAAEAADIPVLSEQVPGEEAVLELEPDLVYAGWESNLGAEGAGDRAELQALGVAGYVSPAACRSADVPGPLGFEEVFREIEEVATIFHADAEPLLAEQRAELAGIEPVEGAPTALWYSSGGDTPYVGAGEGAPQLVLETAGLENIASDVEGAWASLGWESIIAADPDAIVVVDASWSTAASKIAKLEADPATRELSAVRAGNYIVVPFAASEAGVRTVEAAASVAEQSRELGLGRRP